MTPHQLLQLLHRHDNGRAWMYGLHYALLKGHISVQMAERVLKQACVHFERAAGPGYASDHDLAWASVALAKATTRVADERRPVALTQDLEVTHVTTLTTMQYHFENLNGALSESTTLRPGNDATTRFHKVKRILEQLQAAGKLVPKAHATLGKERLWLCPRDASLASKQMPGAAGDVRDERGLVHRGTQDFLVAYAFAISPSVPVYRPTAVDDAGTRFRSWNNASAHHAPLGTAVHLERFAEGAPDMDGVAEGLVAGLALSNDLIQKVVPLGHPKPINVGFAPMRGKAPDGSDGDNAFAKRLGQEAPAHGVADFAGLYELLGITI